jgi:hypothetical protein
MSAPEGDSWQQRVMTRTNKVYNRRLWPLRLASGNNATSTRGARRTSQNLARDRAEQNLRRVPRAVAYSTGLPALVLVLVGSLTPVPVQLCLNVALFEKLTFEATTCRQALVAPALLLKETVELAA